MDIGIAVATTTESWKVVRRAEELGFTNAWFYDTQLLNPDVFIGMTMAAMHTSKIRLGTGVLIPSNRIEPVTANSLATLNKIAPGRIDFGVGTGFTGRRTMGLKAISLQRLKTYVQRVQKLVLGEAITWDFEDEVHDIGFLNPELGLINVDDPIPLHISAFGRRSRQLTAELGAGWLNFGSADSVAFGSLKKMQAAWADAGHAAQDLYSTLFALGCVLHPGEAYDSQRAIAQAGTAVAVFFHDMAETTEPGSMEAAMGKEVSDLIEQYRQVYLRYPEQRRHLLNHKGHLMFLKPEERHLVTADLIRTMTFTGARDELRERLRNLADAGYNQFTVQIVEGQESALEDWAELCFG
jgi:5,10-methylenetetrahydromethanopterin reductase